MIGWADFAEQHGETCAVVDRRLAHGRFPLERHSFPLPKTGTPGLRALSVLDPYDEMIARVFVGRVVPAAMSAVDKAIVFSADVSGKAPGWKLAGHTEGQRKRERTGLDHLSDPRCGGLLALDVREYFPSIAIERLGQALVTWGAPAGATGVLGRTFTEWNRDGTGGLPIGFEGSAVLANAFLSPADEALRHEGVGFVRWMDDSWIFVRDEREADRCMTRYRDALSPLDLELNHSKSRFVDRDAAEFVIHNAVVDYATRGDSKRMTPDEAVDLLDGAIESLGIGADWASVRFSLGALRGSQRGGGIPTLQRCQSVFEEVPKATADYLTAVARGPDRKLLPVDWLAAQACTRGHTRSLSRQLHACRSLTAMKNLSKDVGRDLRNIVEDETTPLPVREWASMAWCQSGSWKAGAALEYSIDGTSDFSLRRAVVAGFRHRGIGATPKARSGFDRLRQLDPDLGPTIAWASGA